jgi:alpha-galactosidase
VQKWFDAGAPISLDRGGEYASHIFNAYLGGEPYKFNGNVPNTGLIMNLPDGVCVEVPVLADKRGLNPMYVGPLPQQCAAMNNVVVATEEMAVEASLTGDPRLVYQAIAYDPLTAAVLSLAEIKDMVAAMLRKNQPYLPQFKSVQL